MRYILNSFLAVPGPTTPELDRVYPVGIETDLERAKERILRRALAFFRETLDLNPVMSVTTDPGVPSTCFAVTVSIIPAKTDSGVEESPEVHHFLVQPLEEKPKKKAPDPSAKS